MNLGCKQTEFGLKVAKNDNVSIGVEGDKGIGEDDGGGNYRFGGGGGEEHCEGGHGDDDGGRAEADGVGGEEIPRGPGTRPQGGGDEGGGANCWHGKIIPKNCSYLHFLQWWNQKLLIPQGPVTRLQGGVKMGVAKCWHIKQKNIV